MEWNGMQTEFPGDRPVHQRFTAQAERHPDAVAIIAQDQQVTYQELEQRSNRLARYLQRMGIRPGAFVAICMERTPDIVVSMLAVLKAGGAYVPLEPAYPPERLMFMIRDSGATAILTQERFVPRLSAGACPAIPIDAHGGEIGRESAESLSTPVAPEHAAYVIYTSGSTGLPKGVVVSHRGLACFAGTISQDYGLGPGDRVLQFHSVSFDSSVEEIYPALVSGGAVVLRSPEMMGSVRLFLQACGELGITVLVLPTAYWHELAANFDTPGLQVPSSIRRVIFGGEAAQAAKLAIWRSKLSDRVALSNTYGPTETTVYVTRFEAGPAAPLQIDEEGVPIGRPLGSVRVHILDERLQPVPPGSPGEICIGGPQVALGYLNRPEQTAERFIPDPFSGSAEARLYRTGDRGRFLPDGNIAYMGRFDHQVKIRGFRIELGEIETALRSHRGVGDAVVLARDDMGSDLTLVAYAVPAAGASLTPALLSGFLRDSLPDYMIPSHFVLLERFPLTASDKIDRKVLPVPVRAVGGAAEPLVLPRTETEKLLADIWADVFKAGAVGIDDHFFELGGHSLAAIQVASRLREQLGVELPLHHFFEAPTIAELAAVIERTPRSEAPAVLNPIRPVPRDGYAPLSFSQERVWFIHELEPGLTAYHFQMLIRFRERLDIPVLERSLAEIIRRHESWRTTFVLRDGAPVQQIHPPYAVALPVSDLSDRTGEEQRAELEQIIQADCLKPFDVGAIPLVRWRLVRISSEEHVLVHVEHHFVHDGWSLFRFMNELKAIYTALACGEPSPLPELPIQYADYAHWQREWMESEAATRQLGFWKRYLAGVTPLTMPTDRQRSTVQTFRGHMVKIELSAELHRRLAAISRTHGATLFMVMLSAFYLLLRRYTGQTDISVGSALANRRTRETELLIGMIVNNVVIRSDISGDPTFGDLIKRVRQTTLEAFANSDVPFEKVVEAVRPKRDLSYNPLFQLMFSFHDSPIPELHLPGVTGQIEYLHAGAAKFDMNVIVNPPFVTEGNEKADGPLVLEWEYNTGLWDTATIERMVHQYHRLLEMVAEEPERRLSGLPILLESERRQMLAEWNDTDASFARESCVHELFEAQAALTPEGLALRFGEETCTYRWLSHRSNKLAHHLRKAGVGPETRVAISMMRSPAMVVGLLGVLKAGGAYVPLDPEQPADRYAWMLEDSAAPVLLTDARTRERLAAVGQVRVICLDSDWEEIDRESGEMPESGVAPENLSYVIYTSGSTGRPKGVLIPHRGVVNYLSWCIPAYGLGPGDRVPVHSSLGFDLTVTSLLAPLVAGGCVLLLPEDQGLEQLTAALSEECLSLVKITPSHLQILNRQLRGEAVTDRVRTMVIGGEALVSPDLEFWRSHSPTTRLINEYGPTETVVGCAIYEVAAADLEQGAVPIGRPIANTQLYVLDEHLHPVPVESQGELYIAGAGLARGYLGRPDLTAESFVPNPFAATPGERMYRTGDLVKWRRDGNLEYLGRVDQQVKIRGYRIELGEIEAVLAGHPAVDACAVLAREDQPGERRLVAYVTFRADERPTATDLRNYLKERLPEHMVPAVFATLEALPLTTNGKVDRRALPVPDQQEYLGTEQAYVPPQTPVESALAEIWREVLGCERIGVHDRFFDIGGHSIAAVRVISRIRSRFGVEFSLRTLFDRPTIAELAEVFSPDGLVAGGGIEGPREPSLKRRSETVADLSDEEVAAALLELLTKEESE